MDARYVSPALARLRGGNKWRDGLSSRVYDARVLTPEILGRTLAEAPDPELARVAISRVGDDAVAREQLARPEVLPVAVRLLGFSTAAADFLVRHPEEVATLADVAPADASRSSTPNWPTTSPRAAPTTGSGSSVAARCCGSRPATSTERRWRTWSRRSRGWPRRAWRRRCALAAGDVRMAVIGLGKLGGGELNYASDVDLIFVHADAGPDAQDAAERAAAALIRLARGADGRGDRAPRRPDAPSGRAAAACCRAAWRRRSTTTSTSRPRGSARR